jgi:NTP pyrophosphatase (non-canonical NTP hydrolase)
MGNIGREKGYITPEIQDHEAETTQVDKALAACCFEISVVSRKAERIRRGELLDLHPAIRATLNAMPSGNGCQLMKVLAMLALVGTEITEAASEAVNGNMHTTFRDSDGKPEGFASEMADIVLRVFALADALDYDLETEIKAKLEYNAKRPSLLEAKKLA